MPDLDHKCVRLPFYKLFRFQSLQQPRKVNVACHRKVNHIGVGYFIFSPEGFAQSGYPGLDQEGLADVFEHEVDFIGSLQVGVGDLLGIEQFLLAQVQVNLLHR